MRSAKIAGQMFENVPRPGGLAGAVRIMVWIFLVLAFVTDAVPSSTSEDWLYKVEARRAAWAQQLSARETRPQTLAQLRSGAPRAN